MNSYFSVINFGTVTTRMVCKSRYTSIIKYQIPVSYRCIENTASPTAAAAVNICNSSRMASPGPPHVRVGIGAVAVARSDCSGHGFRPADARGRRAIAAWRRRRRLLVRGRRGGRRNVYRYIAQGPLVAAPGRRFFHRKIKRWVLQGCGRGGHVFGPRAGRRHVRFVAIHERRRTDIRWWELTVYRRERARTETPNFRNGWWWDGRWDVRRDDRWR